MKKSTVMLWAIFGVLLMSCSEEEIANVETSSRNAIGFNVLSAEFNLQMQQNSD